MQTGSKFGVGKGCSHGAEAKPQGNALHGIQKHQQNQIPKLGHHPSRLRAPELSSASSCARLGLIEPFQFKAAEAAGWNPALPKKYMKGRDANDAVQLAT